MKNSVKRASAYHTPMKAGGKMQGHGKGNKGAASKYHQLAASPKGRNATT